MRWHGVPRYYFTVHDEWGEAADEDGVDLPDLNAARNHAIAGARSLMSHSVRAGILNLGASIDILGGDGALVMRVSFTDALDISE